MSRDERLLDRLEEDLGQAAGWHRPEGVAEEAGVLGGQPALLARDPHPDRAALLLELVEDARRGHGRQAARLGLVGGQVADRPQHVVEPVGIRRAGALAGALEVGLDLLERRRVDQLAQLLLAEQLAQQVAVERQRRGAPLGVGRVALVHVGGDVVEQQRRGERRGALGLDLDERQLAGVQPAQQRLEPGQVEHVAQALAVGLQHDRELAVALGDLEQRLRLEPLLPERRALARPGARQQQRPGGVLAEARAEQGRAGQLAHDQLLQLVGLDQHQLGGGRLVGVGQVDDDAVVRPDRVGLEPELVADARRQRQRPGGMQTAAVGRQHAQAPVADLVAEALDHDRAVARHDARRVALLAQEGGQVARGALVEVVLAAPARPGRGRRPRARRRRSPRPAPSAGPRRRPSRTAGRRERPGRA